MLVDRQQPLVESGRFSTTNNIYQAAIQDMSVPVQDGLQEFQMEQAAACSTEEEGALSETVCIEQPTPFLTEQEIQNSIQLFGEVDTGYNLCADLVQGPGDLVQGVQHRELHTATVSFTQVCNDGGYFDEHDLYKTFQVNEELPPLEDQIMASLQTEEKGLSSEGALNFYPTKSCQHVDYQTKPFSQDSYQTKPIFQDSYQTKPFSQDSYQTKPFSQDSYQSFMENNIFDNLI